MLHIIESVNHLAATSAELARHELTAAKAALLGLVEGVTEYLPISSSGHLIVTERLVDIGRHAQTKDAADTYTITIQAGSILAVLVVYWSRVVEMVRGLAGRDDEGRRLLTALAIAFVPAAIVGLVAEKVIKKHLFGVWPVVVAWIIGGIVILVLARPLHERARAGAPLEAITVRAAVLIGVAQCFALWPGTSRSLVTILAALAVGLTVTGAIEFSFLLGLVTLTAATGYDALKHGSEMFHTYGVLNPVIGFVVAFVAALVAIRWLLAYLQRHDLSIFGWYRLAIAAIAIILLATGVL
ncbi:MAG TPA: undecaprenyl-diphosphate phosphatase [Acidimicrobiia bacterium]|nr:undecaprenyl-diphosphate phosphatase [Acidimicrobiia bacterium]